MTKLIVICVLFLFVNVVVSTTEFTNVVQTQTGKIRGLLLDVVETGRKVELYKAIKFGITFCCLFV